MFKINLVSWNVHGGVNPKNGEKFDINSKIINSDIVFLQEIPEFFSSHEFYENCWMLEPSVHEDSERMGIAVLSKFPVLSVERYSIPKPDWGVEIPSKNVIPHNKGVVVSTLKVGGKCVRVGCLHLLPSYIFDVDESSDEAINYIKSVSDFIKSEVGELDVIAGDFNSSYRGILASALRLKGVTESMPTRDNGKSHDDILLSDSFFVESSAVRESASDHFLIEACVNFED